MFADLHPFGIAIAAADVEWDTPMFLTEEESPAADGGGFDELTRTYLVRSALESVREVVQTHFPRGTRLGTETLWVKKGSGRELIANTFLIQVVFHGRIGPLRYYRETGGVTQQGGASGVSLTPPSGYPFTYPSTFNVRSNEAVLTCKTSYVTTTAPTFATLADTTSGTASGYNALPAGYPNLPTPPASKWAGIADPIYVYPAGWVLEDRSGPEIRDATGNPVCWALTDTHVYYEQERPSGG